MPKRQQTGKASQAGRGAPAAGRTTAFVQNPQYGGRAAAASSRTARPSPFRALNPAYWCCPRSNKPPRSQNQTPTTPTRGQPSPKPRRDAPRNVKGVYRAQPQRILFYHKHDAHYGFTNFSDHPVTYQGKVYPTSEHLFQALKFLPHKSQVAEHIRTSSPSPRAAFTEAHRFQKEVRKDWSKVNVQMMEIALEHKFTQHPALREELLATGDAELVEDSAQDAFWGVGPNGKGRNELGKALMRLRTKLRQQRF
ncbi:hypothetical protein FB107DRAFT_215695 [Schizophyllum commune]